MDTQLLTRTLALGGLIFSIIAFSVRWSEMRRLPFGKDLSVPKDSEARGVFYAFTTGMAPWAKESTRVHIFGYIRGILFHVGIFVGLAVLCVSPWMDNINAEVRVASAFVVGFGAIMGFMGGIMRIVERNLKEFSTHDDHFSVWLVSSFLAATASALLTSTFLSAMYVISFVMFVYAPLSKIRHCIYFYFGRMFFGIHIGRRGIVRGLEAGHG